jgi:hypothetical protein
MILGVMTSALGEESSATAELPAALQQLGVAPTQIVSAQDAHSIRGTGFFPDFLTDNENGFFPSFLQEMESGFRPGFIVEVENGFFPDFLQKFETGGSFPDFLQDMEHGRFPVFLIEKMEANWP